MAKLTDLVEGLQILQKYVDEDEHIGGAEHDILMIAAVPPADISQEDLDRLEELGFHQDEYGGWCRFV
jgi:hypothetical protein